MNTVITEFQQDDINSNYILNYLNKMNIKLNSLISDIDPIQYIENGQGYGKKLTSISSTFIVFGDSFTDGVIAYQPEWDLVLASILTPTRTVISYALNGSTSDQMSKSVNSMFLDTLNAQRTSIIAYGVNDGRRTASLFRYYSAYTNMLLNNYLMCACPQNKFVAGRNFTTKSGTWANTGVSDNSGTYTVLINNYLEHTFTNVKYIYICTYLLKAKEINFSVLINGVVFGKYRIISGPETGVNSGAYCMSCVVLDLNEVIPSVVLRLVNNVVGDFYVSSVCCWNDTDQLTNQRNVLVATIPKYYKYASDDSASGNDFTDEKRRLLNQCIENAVLACVRLGLNISLISYSQINGLHSDKLHPSILQSKMFAYDIKQIATTL